ncbi:MAG: hypothetical protein R6U27_04430 [Desulfobacterales bacterium]
MRFFNLLNNQHIFLYIFPTLVLIILLGLGFGYVHFTRKYTEEPKRLINAIYPEGIEERTAPVPLVLILIIIGTFIWGFCYILGYGLLGVKI